MEMFMIDAFSHSKGAAIVLLKKKKNIPKYQGFFKAGEKGEMVPYLISQSYIQNKCFSFICYLIWISVNKWLSASIHVMQAFYDKGYILQYVEILHCAEVILVQNSNNLYITLLFP